MKNQIILSLSTAAATLFATQLPDVVSNITNEKQLTTQEAESNVTPQVEDKTSELLEQILEQLTANSTNQVAVLSETEDVIKNNLTTENTNQATTTEEAAAEAAAQATAQQSTQVATTSQASKIKISAAQAKEIALGQASGTIV